MTWRIGSFHVGVGQGDRALPYFRKALAAAPDGAKPAIHLELVECLLSLGRGEEAEAEIRSHLAQTPFRDRYIALLSGIGRYKDDSDVFRMVEETLQHPKLSPSARSNLLARKGVMLENSGRFDEAFETILAAKRLLKPPPSSEDFEAAVRERIAVYTKERIARLAEPLRRSLEAAHLCRRTAAIWHHAGGADHLRPQRGRKCWRAGDDDLYRRAAAWRPPGVADRGDAGGARRVEGSELRRDLQRQR